MDGEVSGATAPDAVPVGARSLLQSAGAAAMVAATDMPDPIVVAANPAALAASDAPHRGLVTCRLVG